MNSIMGSLLPIFAMLLPIIFFGTRYRNKKKAEIERLKLAYFDAIKSGDKSLALICGREYYASMRNNGNLTLYDEQAIANDLSVMK